MGQMCVGEMCEYLMVAPKIDFRGANIRKIKRRFEVELHFNHLDKHNSSKSAFVNIFRGK